MKPSISFPGAPMALASAALFGASTPLAKLLLGGGVDPWLLAGLLYLGSGLGLGVVSKKVVHTLPRCETGDAGVGSV
jgi:drug/metabolite transporter (DMT)-like permease